MFNFQAMLLCAKRCLKMIQKGFEFVSYNKLIDLFLLCFCLFWSRSAGAGGMWRYEGPDVKVAVGDTVYYWTLVIINGEGFQVPFFLF